MRWRRYYNDHSRREQLGLLESLLARAAKGNGDSVLEQEIERRTEDLRDAIEKEPYVFDRRFLLQNAVNGALAVCRTYWRARSQHANQFSLRQHHASRRARAGLDSRRPLSPRDYRLGRRRDLRPFRSNGSAPGSLPAVRPQPTKSSKKLPLRSIVGVTA